MRVRLTLRFEMMCVSQVSTPETAESLLSSEVSQHQPPPRAALERAKRLIRLGGGEARESTTGIANWLF